MGFEIIRRSQRSFEKEGLMMNGKMRENIFVPPKQKNE